MTAKMLVMVVLVQLHGLPIHAAKRELHDNMLSEEQLAHLSHPCSAISLSVL
jgi:hypothetical protein